MQLIVGTVAQEIPFDGDSRLSLQNLGPGNLYVDTRSTVTASGSTGGIKILPGGGYESPMTGGMGGKFFVIADAANTDVRYMEI